MNSVDQNKNNLKKFMDILSNVGKIVAFVGLLVSVFIKLNYIFGFVDLNKFKINKNEKNDNGEKDGGVVYH